MLTEHLAKSKEIVDEALSHYQPKAVVCLVSGGNDSLTAYYVAKILQVPITAIVHIHTGTGVQETTDFVRGWAATQSCEYIEKSAGDAYKNYVKRKGFAGRGLRAHSYMYHILKASPLRKAVSSIRLRRRNFHVLMINGIRLDESKNRMYNFSGKTYRSDPAAPNNIFVNIIEHWTKDQCREFLVEMEAPKNPVYAMLHRSGECMCGTMQSGEDRKMAEFFFPVWGNWLNRLEEEVKETFTYGWGEGLPKERFRTVPSEDSLGLCFSCEYNSNMEGT